MRVEVHGRDVCPRIPIGDCQGLSPRSRTAVENPCAVADKRCDELRGFVNVYVNNEDIRYLEDLATPVAPNDEVSIIPAVAGG